MKSPPRHFIMKTIKPIGTISYNTEQYLSKLLDELFYTGAIEDYRFIKHYGEGPGLKDHFHVMIFPNGRLDTYELRKRFDEPDQKSEVPLRCMPFRYSEPLNWILYVLHDEEYLKAHPREDDSDNEGYVYRYEISDIISKFPELLERDSRKAYNIRNNATQKALKMASNGYRYYEILSEIPYINPVALKAILSGLYEDIQQLPNNNRNIKP